MQLHSDGAAALPESNVGQLNPILQSTQQVAPMKKEVCMYIILVLYYSSQLSCFVVYCLLFIVCDKKHKKHKPVSQDIWRLPHESWDWQNTLQQSPGRQFK